MLRRSRRTVDTVDHRPLNWDWEFTASSSGDSYLVGDTRIVIYRNVTESVMYIRTVHSSSLIVFVSHIYHISYLHFLVFVR